MRCALALTLLAACLHPPPGREGESRAISFDWPAMWVPQFDLLFVVDDSPAMAPYRDRVVELGPFSEFALADYTAGMPDVNIGVTTPHADAPLTILTDHHNNDGTRRSSFQGTLGDTLAVALDVGTNGAAGGQQFDAIERALANADFARDKAGLFIVTVSASDDHSLGAVTDSVDTLDAREHGVLAAGVYAKPAPRLDAFHKALGSAFGPFYTAIEELHYYDAFSPITGIVIDFGEYCLDPPAQPYECTVELEENDVTRVVSPCESTPEGECWSLYENPNCRWDGHRGLGIEIRGYARKYRPHVVGQCRI